MTTIPDAKLRELIALGEKATARPWLHRYFLGHPDFPTVIADGYGIIVGENKGDVEDSNAAFIAASANLAVPLAEEVMRLREALREIAEYWNGLENESAMRDACQHNERTAKEALRAQ